MENSEMLPGSVEGGGPSAISVMVTTITTPTTLSTRETLNNMDSVRRRSSPIKLVGLGGLERQNYCCGHWFPSSKSYHRHLAEKAASDLTHEMKLIEIGMIRCTSCSMWVHMDSMSGHLRKVHSIVKVAKNTTKVLPASTAKDIMGISGETLKSGTNFVIKVSGQAGARNTNGDVSAVANSSGLKLVTTSSGSLYQKVQLQQAVNSGSSKLLLPKTGVSNSIPLVSLGPRIVMKSAVKAVAASNSVQMSSGSKIIPLQSSGQVIPAARTMAGMTTVQIAGGTMLASSSGTSQTSSVPTSFVQSKKSANLNGQNFGRLIKKCATLKPKNQPVVDVQPADNNSLETYSKTKDRGKASISGDLNVKPAQSKKSRKQVLQPSIEPEASLLSVSPSVLKLKKKGRKLSGDVEVFAEDKVSSPKPSVNHKGYRRKLKDNPIENNTPKSSKQNTKGMRGGMKKKRGPGRPRKERVIETPDLSEIDSLFNEVDKEDAENEPYLMTKEEENIPTVELDLFTLPSLNEQVSVLLTEPQNPNFKVYASMDAIFVGDSALGDVTNQIGYVTDANNVVYVNPSHFLFPNVEDLENFVPSPIVTMKGNKIGVNPSKVCKLNTSKPVAPTMLRENKFVTSSHPREASSSELNVEKVSVDERESQVPSAKLKGPERVPISPGSELDQTGLLSMKPLRATKADPVRSEQTNPDTVALGTTSDSSVREILCPSASDTLNSVSLDNSSSRNSQTETAGKKVEKREVSVVSKVAQSKGEDLFFSCKNTIEMPVNICEGDGEGDQSQDEFATSEDSLSCDLSEKSEEKPAYTSETAKLLLYSLETITGASSENKDTRDQIITDSKDWTDEGVSTERDTVPEASELDVNLESKDAERESVPSVEKSETCSELEAIEEEIGVNDKSESTLSFADKEPTEARDSDRKVSTVIPRRRSRTRSADITLGPVKASPQNSGLQNFENVNKKPQLRTRTRQKSDSAVLSETHEKIQDFSTLKELCRSDIDVQKRLEHAGETEKTVLDTVKEKESLLCSNTNVLAQNHNDTPVPETLAQSGDLQDYPMAPKDSSTETVSNLVSEESTVFMPAEEEEPIIDQSAKPVSVDPVRKKVGRPRKKRRGKLLESSDVKVLKDTVEAEPSVVPVSKEEVKQSVSENVPESRPVRERRPSSKLIESLSFESTKKNKSPRAALDHQSWTNLDSDEFIDKQQEQDTCQEERISRISCVPTQLLLDDKDNEVLDKDYVSPVRGADLSPSREWHGRGAKLKAQVLIQDQQAGVTDSQILPSSLETSPNPKGSPGSAGPDTAPRPPQPEECLSSHSSPPKTHISKSPISPRSLKSPRSPSHDDREWQARRAKLKAQVMISDQQSGLSDFIVDSAEEDPVAPESASPPVKKLKLDVSPGATRDIRSFFSVCKSPESADAEQPVSPLYVSPSIQSPPAPRSHKKRINRYSNMKTDIRSFFSVDNAGKRKLKSPPHHSPKSLRISDSMHSKSTKSSPRKQDVQAVQKLHQTFEKLEKEAFDIAAPALPSNLQNFEGFERCSRQSGLRAKSLLRLVSLLDMKRWYHLGKFPLPVDHLCDWNEEVLNSNIFD
ncbi:titin homolog [Penaeus chinensis]|uniref:titin homolog n=1 Tax=Penaeus chinensis TaxID=139456 RepID=UPI001FB657F2|nr:titin homolog [Penaeus chinensis]